MQARISKEEILRELGKIIDPELGMDIVKAGIVKEVEISDGNVIVKIAPTSPFCPLVRFFEFMIERAARSMEGVKEVKVLISFDR